METELGDRVRCDVLAVVRQEGFEQYVFAFECKRPDSTWDTAKWSKVILQASSYVNCKITDKKYQGPSSKVKLSFLYPSPIVHIGLKDFDNVVFADAEEAEAIGGAFHLALYFGVGRLLFRSGSRGYYELILGPNEVWRSDYGIRGSGKAVLQKKRRIGSQQK